MAERVTLLRALLRERHWQKYATFCREYDRAARSLDQTLVGTWPSRAQLHRWLRGDLKGLPYPDHCRILERMLPPWPVQDLLKAYPTEVAAQLVARRAGAATPTTASTNDAGPPPVRAGGCADVERIFGTRGEFRAALPPDALLGRAREIAAVGLSLDLVCQQFPGPRLLGLVRGGATVRCAFLDPTGAAMRSREAEEGYPAGHLSVLTELNIQALIELRNALPEDARHRIEVVTYEDVLRFNIVLIDNRACVMQPFLPPAAGVESPTFLIERKWDDAGLFPVFARLFEFQWSRSKPR